MTDLSLVPEIAAYKGINFKSLIDWMIKMHLKTNKRFNYLFYITLIIILSSTNNYNFYNKNLFKIKKLEVTGFSKEKNMILKKEN